MKRKKGPTRRPSGKKREGVSPPAEPQPEERRRLAYRPMLHGHPAPKEGQRIP